MPIYYVFVIWDVFQSSDTNQPDWEEEVDKEWVMQIPDS